MSKMVYVLWTGGWDSTFRIVQLSRIDGIEIQGVYISGDGRHSEQREIQAMNDVIKQLETKSTTLAKILPVKIIDKMSIPADEQITSAYNELRKEFKIGTQYEWIARYAKLHPGIELGAIMPDGEFSGLREIINKYGGLIEKDGSYYIDQTAAPDKIKLIFGNFSYPLAFTKEREMVEVIKQWGYEDVMSMIWFCHRPYKGKPCGICRPCEQKMEGNMEFLLPDDAKKRYRIMKYMTKVFGSKGRTLLYRIYRI